MTRLLLSVAIHSTRRVVDATLAARLAEESDFTVVGRTGRWPDLLTLCEVHRPHAVVVDVSTRVGDTIGWLRLLRIRCPSARVLLVYDHLSARELAEAGEAGIGTLIPYTHQFESVVTALRDLIASAQHSLSDRLSHRELEIIALMGAGHRVPEIAALLHLSPHTVENYKRHLYSKLDVTSQTHAVSRALSLGLIDRPMPRQRSAAGTASGRPAVVLVAGAPGHVTERVLRALLGRPHAFVVERVTGPLAAADRVRWAGRRVVAVLVDPTQDDWEVVGALDAPTVVVASANLDSAAVADLTGRGAAGIVLAHRIGDHLGHVLALVVDGYTAVQGWPPPVPRPPGAHPDRRTTDPVKLSARERDILASIARGHTVRQTALALGIATKTVENLQAHLFGKLGVHSRIAALNMAQVLGLVQLGPTGGLAAPLPGPVADARPGGEERPPEGPTGGSPSS